MGRGKVTVNWENCIKCESCWRSEPDRALWGRFTDHGLIYRPESGAMAGLLGSLKQSVRTQEPAKPAQVVDQQLWYLSGTVAGAVARVVNAAAAFRDSLDRLPASPDAGRCSWPRALGIRLIEKMTDLEALLRADERPDAADEIADERSRVKLRLDEGRLFHCRYAVSRLEDLLRSWSADTHPHGPGEPSHAAVEGTGLSYDDLSRLFPDRVVKQWEEEPMPREWEEMLGQFIRDHHKTALPAIRALSSVSPALGLIAACQMKAMNILARAGRTAEPGVCAFERREHARREKRRRTKTCRNSALRSHRSGQGPPADR